MRVGSLQDFATVRIMIVCGLGLLVFGFFISRQVSALALDIAYQQQVTEQNLNDFGTRAVTYESRQ
jgi:uncharacterized membrane protein